MSGKRVSLGVRASSYGIHPFMLGHLMLPVPSMFAALVAAVVISSSRVVGVGSTLTALGPSRRNSAYGRTSPSNRRDPLAKITLRALGFAYRSLLAARSERESELSRLIPLTASLASSIETVAMYSAHRHDEVEVEAFLDRAIGSAAIHTAERAGRAKAVIHKWQRAMKAALESTRELVELLVEERPIATPLYEAKGAGLLVEFALRLMSARMRIGRVRPPLSWLRVSAQDGCHSMRQHSPLQAHRQSPGLLG